jgi:hypothetical protein
MAIPVSRDAVRHIGTRPYDWASIERVAVSSTSAQSAAISANEVTVHASTKCYILAGANPTAAASTSIPLEAGEKFSFQIPAGHKIAVIRDSADGYLHIAPVVS